MVHEITSRSIKDHINGSAKPVIIGSIFGLLFISSFLIRVNPVHPDWGKFWMIQPLVVGALAGAGGGFFFYFMNLFRFQGAAKVLSVFVCLIVFVIAMWMGIVLGFHGTMWN
jgi:hypothetical protein